MKLLNFLLLVIIFLALAGCDSANKQDTLIIATSADNPPYEFIQDNNIVGLDIDIINAIAQQLGKKVVIKNLDFHGLLAALAGKNVDLVIAGLSVTPERQASVDFSMPYISTTVAVLHRKSDILNQQQDLKDKNIGAQLGTTWAKIAQDLSKDLTNKVHFLSNNLMLVEELKSKVVDAVILEEVQAKKFVANNPELAYFVLQDFASKFAVAMPKGSALKTDIDNAIQTLQKSGHLKAVRKKWLE